MASAATMTTVTAITKEIYEGKIREQLQDEVIGLKRIERTSQGVSSTVGGRYVTFPLRVKRNQGIGYRAEDGTLPAAGSQGYVRVTVGLKYGYGRIHLTGQVMELAESNFQAFASAMDREMSGLKSDIAKDSARIFYGNGSGLVATATGSNSAAVVPCTNTQNIQIGMKLDSYTGGTLDNTALVVASVIPNTSFTLTGTPGTAIANGDIFVRTGNRDLEPQGVTSLVGTAALFGIDPAGSGPNDSAEWKSVVNANGGSNRALTEALMIRMTDDVRVNGGKTSLILTSLGVRRVYFNLLTANRRYVNTQEFAGGLTGLAFSNGRDIPVIEDVDAPPNKLWFLDEDTFKVYRDKDWHWINNDGNIWKWVTNTDAFEAVLRQYWELSCDRRNANGVLADITEA